MSVRLKLCIISLTPDDELEGSTALDQILTANSILNPHVLFN